MDCGFVVLAFRSSSSAPFSETEGAAGPDGDRGEVQPPGLGRTTRRAMKIPAGRSSLSPKDVLQRPMSTGKPKQAQDPDDEDLSHDWKAVDEEGDDGADDRRFDQAEHTHVNLTTLADYSWCGLPNPPRCGSHGGPAVFATSYHPRPGAIAQVLSISDAHIFIFRTGWHCNFRRATG